MQILHEARRQGVFPCNWHRSLVGEGDSFLVGDGKFGGSYDVKGDAVYCMYICIYMNEYYNGYDMSFLFNKRSWGKY